MRPYTIINGLTALASVTAAAAVRPRTGPSSNPGIDLTNASDKEATYFFCNNISNGDGTADPGIPCTNMVTKVTVKPSRTASVSLGADFKGRIVRATDMPATWVEVQIRADDGNAWGDVSLQAGCDGAATVAPADGGGSGAKVGFEGTDVVGAAPEAAKTTREGDGETVIATPWSMGKILNQEAVGYLKQKVGVENAYIDNVWGTDVAVSSNNRLAVVMF
ncbi:hypothetical protein KVR01_011943 [Diaporthe batatas]|uniref:uncharacterized protein n=1 Tax=Diaporthe batatas TaxID=748121 RepID=UPI001D043228|nr:uncharacterized protein KVR01_011943 [Diaporthe batatas]KAG8158182.1 hypothetical protein KVR01_011943 [Diaporthe batatas]